MNNEQLGRMESFNNKDSGRESSRWFLISSYIILRPDCPFLKIDLNNRYPPAHFDEVFHHICVCVPVVWSGILMQ